MADLEKYAFNMLIFGVEDVIENDTNDEGLTGAEHERAKEFAYALRHAIRDDQARLIRLAREHQASDSKPWLSDEPFPSAFNVTDRDGPPPAVRAHLNRTRPDRPSGDTGSNAIEDGPG